MKYLFLRYFFIIKGGKMNKVFKQSKERKKLQEMIKSKIKVDGVIYDFKDMIENEYVSDFPVYSHRMRNTVAKGVELFDAFIVECDKNLYTMETNVELYLNEKYNELVKKNEDLRNEHNKFTQNKNEEYKRTVAFWEIKFAEFGVECQNKFNQGKADYENFTRTKKSEYDTYIASKKQDYDTYTKNKKQDYETFVSNKKQEYENKKQEYEDYINQTANPKITEITDRINRFDELKKGVYASYPDVYLLTIDAWIRLGNFTFTELIKKIDPDDANAVMPIIYWQTEKIKNAILGGNQEEMVNAIKLCKNYFRANAKKYTDTTPLKGKFLITEIEEGNKMLHAHNNNFFLNYNIIQPVGNYYEPVIAGKKYPLRPNNCDFTFENLPGYWREVGNTEGKYFCYFDLENWE